MKQKESKTIQVPVTIRKGKIEFSYGGPLPGFIDGKFGVLEMPEDSFSKPGDVELLSASKTVELFAAGDVLQAHMAPKKTGNVLGGLTKIQYATGFWGEGYFAPIHLQEPLRLAFSRSKKADLEPCKCHLPGIQKTAESINEAYTRLSEHYETHRRSHSGNVFDKILFLPKGGKFWFPLDKLRQERQDAFEAKAFHSEKGLFAEP